MMGTVKTAIASLCIDDKFAFYTHILLNLNIIESKDISTACVNTENLYINPEFVKSLSHMELKGLLIHEVLHLAFEHGSRIKDRDHRRFNIAADYAINPIIIGYGLQIPKGGLLDYKYTNMTAEAIYEQIPETEKLPMEDIIETGEQDKLKLKKLLSSALHVSNTLNASNTLPGELRKRLNKLLNPSLPWNVILNNYLNDYVKNLYSYKKPNRRYVHSNTYLPSVYSEGIDRILLAVDTSGSISEDTYREIMSEISSITQSSQCNDITLIDWNTEITREIKIDNDTDLLSLSPSKTGGTDIIPVINYVNKRDFSLVIIFSDFKLFTKPSKPENTTTIGIVYNSDINPNELKWLDTAIFY